MSDDPEVLIIGAGPVGLSGAITLGRAGIRCLVLERRGEFSRYPKANGVHLAWKLVRSCAGTPGTDCWTPTRSSVSRWPSPTASCA